jgi:hypothetical protein
VRARLRQGDLTRGQGLELAAVSSELHIQYIVWRRVLSQLCVGRPRWNAVRSAGFEISSDSGSGFRGYANGNFCERNRRGSHSMPNSYRTISTHTRRLLATLRPFTHSSSIPGTVCGYDPIPGDLTQQHDLWRPGAAEDSAPLLLNSPATGFARDSSSDSLPVFTEDGRDFAEHKERAGKLRAERDPKIGREIMEIRRTIPPQRLVLTPVFVRYL